MFAKLYTKGHVRADRWYKLGRTIAYGSMEDEVPFQTVRRLAEYEDYALHLVREAGVRTARPYGIVEITPEREYLAGYWTARAFIPGPVALGTNPPSCGTGPAVILSAQAVRRRPCCPVSARPRPAGTRTALTSPADTSGSGWTRIWPDRRP